MKNIGESVDKQTWGFLFKNINHNVNGIIERG